MRMLFCILISTSLFLLASLVNTSRQVTTHQRAIDHFLDKELAEGATRWAILFAGSNKYENYRHQADICHAYQILKAGGLKDENVIVFMYDDIAYNKKNPHPGTIINRPGGPNVYEGVPKDYTGTNVSSTNFFAVLRGDRGASGTGKVLNSGPNDHVFFYFADHGGLNALLVLGTDLIWAKDLNAQLIALHKRKAFAEMLIYIEACESGSMFEDEQLPKNIDVFAATSASSDQSSWACYCPGDPGVPKEVTSCLGDEFSVAWMEDADESNRDYETIGKQIDRATKRVKKSNVQIFGDTRIEAEPIDTFEGLASTAHDPSDHYGSNLKFHQYDQHDADLLHFWANYINSSGLNEIIRFESLKELHQALAQRVTVDKLVSKLMRQTLGDEADNKMSSGVNRKSRIHDRNRSCVEELIKEFQSKCSALHEWGFRHINKFAEICDKRGSKDVKSLFGLCSPDISVN